LQTIKVKDLMESVRKVTLIPQDMTFSEFKSYFSKSSQHYFPVMDQYKKLSSIFSINDVRGVLFSPEIERLVVMKDIGTSEIIVTTPSEDLNGVLKKFTTKNIDSLPVVQEDDHTELIGMLNRREVIAFYNEQIQNMKTGTAALEAEPEAD
jgi:CIC family chloride channel protein